MIAVDPQLLRIQALPDWYPDLLASVSDRVPAGRRRAIATVNAELVATYWAVGRAMLDRQVNRDGMPRSSTACPLT